MGGKFQKPPRSHRRGNKGIFAYVFFFFLCVLHGIFPFIFGYKWSSLADGLSFILEFFFGGNCFVRKNGVKMETFFSLSVFTKSKSGMICNHHDESL